MKDHVETTQIYDNCIWHMDGMAVANAILPFVHRKIPISVISLCSMKLLYHILVVKYVINYLSPDLLALLMEPIIYLYPEFNRGIASPCLFPFY